MPRLITGLVFIVVGVSSSAWATPITISLANNGVQQFLTPFPNIEVTGASAQPVSSSVGPGTFGYDFVVHVLVPNGGGSLLTGQITFDFGAAGSFVGALSGNAFASAPVIDPITGFRTVTENAPFNFLSGTGVFLNAGGTGSLILTTLRQTDVSPTATFVSTGSTNLDTIPEPGSMTLLGSGIAGLVAAARRRHTRANPS